MKFHFFITAFNEQNNLNDTVESLLIIIGQEKLDEYSITILNDASTDGTKKIIYDLSKKYKEIKIINNNLNLGVCCSLKKFLTEIQGGKLVLISGDNEIGPDLIKNLIISSRDHDFVISYFENNENKGYIRSRFSTIFNKIYCLIFSVKAKYLQGPFVWPVDEIKKFNIISNGITFVSEINIKLLLSNLNYIEVSGKNITGSKNSTSMRFKNFIDIFFVTFKLFFQIKIKKIY